MTTYASQNMGAKDLDRVDRGVYTALGIGCVYSIASFLIPVSYTHLRHGAGQCAAAAEPLDVIKTPFPGKLAQKPLYDGGRKGSVLL